MNRLPASAKGVLVVAVAFDDLQEVLVQTATSLARAFEMEVRLVNVLDVPVAPLFIDPTGYALAAYPIASAVDAMAQERRARLAKLAAGMGLEGRVRIDVIAGDTAGALGDYACLHRANLLLTGCSPRPALIPQGLSTALTLMAHAPLPVLVVGRECVFDAEKGALRILLADDLQAGSEEAARRAFELAKKRAGVVRHLHVHGDFREILRDTWRDLAAAHPRLLDVHHEAEALLRQDSEVRLAALAARGAPYRAQAEAAGVTVETDCRLGKVLGELHDCVAEFRPDLLVFGRHRTVKGRPFVLGRAPFSAMLREHLPVLVVPPAAELYANLAFPAA